MIEISHIEFLIYEKILKNWFYISGYNADIICLQEVDRKIFNSCLTSFLAYEGLKGLFYKKGKQVAEGLACFYREKRFR